MRSPPHGGPLQSDDWRRLPETNMQRDRRLPRDHPIKISSRFADAFGALGPAWTQAASATTVSPSESANASEVLYERKNTMASTSAQNDIAAAPDLTRLLADRYTTVRTQHPGEGRRKSRLRVAQEFWNMSRDEKAAYASRPPLTTTEAEDADFETDDDPLDALSTDAPGIGIIVRTDFSDEEAWQEFCAKLQDAERELSSDDAMVEDVPAEGQGTSDVPMDTEQDADDREAEEVEDVREPVFSIIDPPPSSPLRTLFTSISNLLALRLLNDVSLRPSPSRPVDTPRIKPLNRLVDHDGFQEVYIGKMLWIYDERSNKDQCVRLVSQSGAMYGTATADSWRARVSHICELQLNLASGAMTIDFGGMDRWDYPERVRNMEEASRPIS